MDIHYLRTPSRYRHIVGGLVYLTITRPDIAQTVHILSQFVSSPRCVYFGRLLRVLRYLRGTSSQCLFCARESALQLHAYPDFTSASDPTDRRYLTSYCILGSSPLMWETSSSIYVDLVLRHNIKELPLQLSRLCDFEGSWYILLSPVILPFLISVTIWES